jgi:hypothetical protein
MSFIFQLKGYAILAMNSQLARYSLPGLSKGDRYNTARSSS